MTVALLIEHAWVWKAGDVAYCQKPASFHSVKCRHFAKLVLPQHKNLCLMSAGTSLTPS